MRCAGDKVARGGFTVLEIMIVLAIVGILVMIAAGNFKGLSEKFKVEAETKQLYADLMDARGRAMQRDRMFFVQINGNAYNTYEDTFSVPDGDMQLNTGDMLVASAILRHGINTDNLVGGTGFAFSFNGNGIASVNGTGTIRLVSQVRPDYDCITVKPTRTKMGQWGGGICVEK
ncbi:MAG: prepilin-type N-terminal cleavage/methylation domain-containing protein [Deltaproteobacteria bacterium]|nr:prepilin-type N-terminal cleavage/methylation domain-containing protein [Deltaproteobacteria bacterium]